MGERVIKTCTGSRPQPTHDPVNSPQHYTTGNEKCPECGHPIECIDVTEHRDFLIGNAIKYLWRAGAKDDEVQDLRKAIWYIERRIKQAST